jgi:ABC-type sugar transport system substrate-binding protein
MLQEVERPMSGRAGVVKSASRRRRVVIPVAAAAVLSLAACGGSSGSKSSFSGGSSSSGAQSKTASLPAPITSPPAKIQITQPWTKTPPKGKTIFWLQCELPICAKIADGGKAAAAAIGWKYRSVVFKAADPAGGMQTALDRKPDAIFISGIPSAAIKSQLAGAAKARIPVVGCGDPEQPAPGGYSAMCGTTTEADGEQLALWTTKNSGGNVHIVSVSIPSYTLLKTQTDGIASGLKKYCPKCSADVLPLTVDDLGSGQVASKVVAYLQTHPKVNYISFTFADLEAGVGQAIKAAGLDKKVKFIGNGAGPAQFKTMIAGGTPDAAWMAYPAVLQGWLSVDAAARLVADGGKLPDGYQKSLDHLQSWIIDSSASAKSLAPSYDWAGPANYQQQFTQLWQPAG